MKQILLSLLFLMIVQGSLCAQERTYITETDDYIAWQPGVKLTFDMFKNPKPSEKDSVSGYSPEAASEKARLWE